jgi:putative membrane protein
MTLAEALPSWNASMNAASACALFAGWAAIRRGNRALHWKLMSVAFGASVLFLAGYLTRFALTGVHRFPLQGSVRTVYYVLLATHTVLAAIALPFVLRTMWLSAVRRSYDRHKRIAVWTFPMWAYVSVTGVLVYVMLYHLPRWLA